MNAPSIVTAVAVCSLLCTGSALAAPQVCSTSNLILNTSPIANGTDGRCTSPLDTATSQRSVGFQDSGDPGQGNWAARGAIRAGAFGGNTHVSVSQVGSIETLFASESIAYLFDGLTVDDAAHVGTAGTLEIPVHVTGSFRGSSSNVPTASPALPPTISGSFRFVCAGSTFGGGCGNQTLSFDSTDGGPASLPIDQIFTMTMPIVFGQPLLYNVTFTLNTGLRGSHCINCGVETTSSGNVDAGSTGRFGAAIVRDGNGDVVPGATITSDSGHDYTVVPEPAEDELGLAAVGCLGALLRTPPRRAAEAASRVAH